MSYFDLIFHTFITLFVIVDPLGCVPIFSSLTAGMSPKMKRKTALRAPLIAFGILVFFMLLGDPFLKMLGISISAFRIAGGVMLFIVALEMLFLDTQGEKTPCPSGEEINVKDVSVFPLAIPLLAGPGSIAALLLLMSSQRGNLTGQFLVFAVTGVLLILTSGLFLMTNKISKYVTKTVDHIITKVLGVVLGALSVQFVIDGILGVLGR